jgi:hypothetical protein
MNPDPLPDPQRDLIRASWLRFGALAGGLVLSVMGALFFMGPRADAWVIETMILPGYESTFGFRGGWLQAPGQAHPTIYAILDVTPGGRFSGAGVLKGDIPIAHHGNGSEILLHALQRAETGSEARFYVYPDVEEKGSMREIVLKPTARTQ